jgi:hypothetical protein
MQVNEQGITLTANSLDPVTEAASSTNRMISTSQVAVTQVTSRMAAHAIISVPSCQPTMGPSARDATGGRFRVLFLAFVSSMMQCDAGSESTFIGPWTLTRLPLRWFPVKGVPRNR